MITPSARSEKLLGSDAMVFQNGAGTLPRNELTIVVDTTFVCEEVTLVVTVDSVVGTGTRVATNVVKVDIETEVTVSIDVVTLVNSEVVVLKPRTVVVMT
jgi:hypothetical protein